MAPLLPCLALALAFAVSSLPTLSAGDPAVLISRYLSPWPVNSVCVGVDQAVATIRALYPFQSVPPLLADGPRVCLSTPASPSNGRYFYVGVKANLGIHRCASINDVKLFLPTTRQFLDATSLPGRARSTGYVATNWRPDTRQCGAPPVPGTRDAQQVSVVNHLDEPWVVSTSLPDDPLYPGGETFTDQEPYEYANLTLQSAPMLQAYFSTVLNTPEQYIVDYTRLFGALLMDEGDGTVAYSAYRFAAAADCGFTDSELQSGAGGYCILADVFEAGYDVSDVNWTDVNLRVSAGEIGSAASLLSSTVDPGQGQPVVDPAVVGGSAGGGSAVSAAPAPAPGTSQITSQAGGRRLLGYLSRSGVKASPTSLGEARRRLGTRAASTSNIAVTGMLCYLSPGPSSCLPGGPQNCLTTCRPN